jgi:hypothetical protein
MLRFQSAPRTRPGAASLDADGSPRFDPKQKFLAWALQ